jgi:hypothetical protein
MFKFEINCFFIIPSNKKYCKIKTVIPLFNMINIMVSELIPGMHFPVPPQAYKALYQNMLKQ